MHKANRLPNTIQFKYNINKSLSTFPLAKRGVMKLLVTAIDEALLIRILTMIRVEEVMNCDGNGSKRDGQ